MLTYSFENAKGPLYEHLYKCIKTDISSGILAAGEQLPSKRSFAKNLGVSTITVENAYDQLIGEGYVYALPKKGYYVADLAGIPKPEPVRVLRDIQLPPEKAEIDFDLSGNQISFRNFPFSVWAGLMRTTVSERNDELMTKSPCNGIYMLREAVSEHLRSFRGMDVDPDQIIIGAGTEYLYGVLIQLLGRDKIYCVENPGYSKISQIYKSNEVVCRFTDMDEKGITAEGLRAVKADIAHISPTHHFPTGITMPIDRRYELLAWANEENGRYIIEDDYDSEFRLIGKPIPSLQSIDVSEKVIYINTFSKSLAPTIRISYMVLPVHLVNHFYRDLSFYSCTVSNFEQYTLAHFIKEGYFEKHINRMRLFYARQRKKVFACIQQSPLRDRCDIIEKDSGLHFLVRLHTTMDHSELCRQLAAQKIHLASLTEYYQNPAGSEAHMFLFNYSNLNVEELRIALERIDRILRGAEQ